MIEKIINRIVDFLEIENLIKQEQEEFYRYGSELLVMSLINGFSVLLVGIVKESISRFMKESLSESWESPVVVRQHF